MNVGEVPVLTASLVILLVLVPLVLDRDPAPAPAPSDGSLTVMTYNVHQFYSSGKTGDVNLRAVADVIRASGAHIVGLQESEGARITSGHVDGVRWLARELGMFWYRGPPTSEQIYGVSVLSAWPFHSTKWFPLPATQSIERAAVLVEIDAPLGIVPVLDAHLQTVEYHEDRLAQAMEVVRLVEPFAQAVVLGDFNTPADPTDKVYAMLNATFVDAWKAAPDSRNETGATELDTARPERIDHVWLKGAWSVGSCSTWGHEAASDHLGVACRVRPAGAPFGRA